jgi:pyruvate formate lyase activating enzyme
MEAKYYNKLDDNVVQCILCPHNCVIANGNVGICNARRNKEGVLVAETYGKTISFSMDPIEKKPLFHFKPFSQILSLGHNSCNLKCQYCQNASVSQNRCRTHEISPADLLDYCLQNKITAVAFTYTEPFTWFEFIFDCATLLKQNNIDVVLVTNGFVNKDPLKEILPLISAVNIDLKSIKGSFYKDICKGTLNPVLEMIKTCYKRTWVEVTNLIITDTNDKFEEIETLVKEVANIGKDIPLHLSRYFPSYKFSKPSTTIDKMFEVYSIADRYLDYVYLGNIASSEGSYTKCPNCNSVLIDRIRRRNYLFFNGSDKCKSAYCGDCHTEIAGVW